MSTDKQRIHFIAIGGAIMHQLAIALKRYGNEVSGSDDKIKDPSRSNLDRHGLLPEEGWDFSKITSDLDLIILGMHAKADNPELLKAQELGIPIYSFPEYVANLSKDKKRIVVGGSHGKTSTTAMIMHVLRKCDLEFDYLVGSKLDDFDYMVELSDAPLIVIEGDEYLSSCLDRRPKFHWYKPHISILTGVSLDHVNVFPTEEIYNKQFELFLETLDKEAKVFYYGEDEVLKEICPASDAICKPYESARHRVKAGTTYLLSENESYPLKVFGTHMLQNMQACMLVCKELGIPEVDICEALSDFGGTARRMETLVSKEDFMAMRDFAHSPSKVEATVKALKEQYPGRHLVAFLELHTFSSVQEDFLPRYEGTLDVADTSVLFLDKGVFEQKGRPLPSQEVLTKAFGDIAVLNTKEELASYLETITKEQSNYLFMSSGTFGGFDFSAFS